MIAVIDVCGNNLTSLSNALKNLGVAYALTHDPKTIYAASHVILPGVGAAAPAMKAIDKYGLADVFSQLNQPVLGICLGMQLLLQHSEEDDVTCLNLIPGTVQRLPQIADHPVPHMGWSRLLWTKTSPLSQGLQSQDYVYFVHSFAVLNNNYALATCQYSEQFTAIIQHNNFYGMQFHPEKSSTTGLKLLNNFLKLESAC